MGEPAHVRADLPRARPGETVVTRNRLPVVYGWYRLAPRPRLKMDSRDARDFVPAAIFDYLRAGRRIQDALNFRWYESPWDAYLDLSQAIVRWARGETPGCPTCGKPVWHAGPDGRSGNVLEPCGCPVNFLTEAHGLEIPFALENLT